MVLFFWNQISPNASYLSRSYSSPYSPKEYGNTAEERKGSLWQAADGGRFQSAALECLSQWAETAGLGLGHIVAAEGLLEGRVRPHRRFQK
jgi:hypothetical protein